MRWFARVVLLLFLPGPLALGGDDRPARKVLDAKLQDRINRAIAQGTAYLKKVQNKNGSWAQGTGAAATTPAPTTGGHTALALYALSASRVPASDPAIRRGVKWTEKHAAYYGPSGVYGTYSASLLVLALTRIDERKHRARIHKLADLVVRSQLKSDMWTYRLNPSRGTSAGRGRRRGDLGGGGDNSNSQFAVLALWAAEALAGYKAPRRTWERIRDFYRKAQVTGGGWNYNPTRGRGRGSATMTAAGLVSYVYATAALKDGVKSLAAARRVPVAQRGLRAFEGMPSNRSRQYYLVYSTERVGTVMARPIADWYVEGARDLVGLQVADGRWPAPWGGAGIVSCYETSLALLFLSRATGRLTVTVTKREAFPDLAKADQVARAFDFYHAYNPRKRREVVHEFGKAGRAAVEYFIRRLRDRNPVLRRTAFELLDRLVEKRFFFEPSWPPEDRLVMLGPIEDFWRTHGDRLRWSVERRRFVVVPLR